MLVQPTPESEEKAEHQFENKAMKPKLNKAVRPNFDKGIVNEQNH